MCRSCIYFYLCCNFAICFQTLWRHLHVKGRYHSCSFTAIVPLVSSHSSYSFATRWTKIDLRTCHPGLTFVAVCSDFKQRKTCTSKDGVCGLCGMWLCVAWEIGTHMSEEPAAWVLSVEESWDVSDMFLQNFGIYVQNYTLLHTSCSPLALRSM